MKWTERLRIMRENREIAQNGSYTAADGSTVCLSRTADKLKQDTFMLLPEHSAPDADIRTNRFTIADSTMKTDTIGCILTLRKTITGEIIALNFANANVAGGGYRFGGDAQEESLCRCSMLYAAIAPHRAYYRYHHRHPTPLYSDRMLISPDVPVIRTMDGKLLANPVLCTFLTCAAVNRRIAKLMLIPNKPINNAMERRICGILAAMAARKPAAVVLGAFGCGAFGNRWKTVYPMLEAAVNRYLPDETAVYFAAP